MQPTDQHVYAAPRHVSDIKDCYFYHTMHVPGHGVVEGEWDLRNGVDDYLGRVPLNGKRVLEMGTASGFLCFEMEKRGAEVVAYDLSEHDNWDVVPFGGTIAKEYIADRKDRIRGLNNAWWFTRELLQSKARVVYGSVYEVPAAIGDVDITTFGSILLHVRDPFLAIQRAAALTKETIVITDVSGRIPRQIYLPFMLLPRAIRKHTVDRIRLAPAFLPDPRKRWPWDAWWHLTPELVERFLHILGFTDTTITSHSQSYRSARRSVGLFTVVGRRTAPRTKPV